MKTHIFFLMAFAATLQAEERVQQVAVEGRVEARNYADMTQCREAARQIAQGLIALEGGGASELHDSADTFVVNYVGAAGVPRRQVDIYCFSGGEMRLYLLRQTQAPSPPIIPQGH